MRSIVSLLALTGVLLTSCNQNNNNTIPNTNNNNNNTPHYYVKAKVNGVPWEATGDFMNCTGDVFDHGGDSSLNMYGQGDYNGAAYELFFEVERHYAGTGTYMYEDLSFEFHKFLSNDDNFMYYGIYDSSDFLTLTSITSPSFKGTFQTTVVGYGNNHDTLRITDGIFEVRRD